MLGEKKSVNRKVCMKVLLRAGGGLILLAVLALLVYQIPAVRDRLGWRVETARVFLRSLFKPIQDVPTAVSREVSLFTVTPIPSPTSLPSVSGLSEETQPAAAPTETPAPTPLPASASLESPPFEPQDWNNCGPVSLSMYLHYYGWNGDQFSISDLVKPLRDDRNVNVDELAGYVTNQVGWLRAVYRVDGDLQLLRTLLANGFPVMIEESMMMAEPFWYNDDLWAGHYLLLTGYDEAAGTFTVQDSFVGLDQKVSYDRLDANWQAFNRVYLLVYPPERENEIIDILGKDWNADVNRENALQTAQRETQTQPDNAFAWFNLGGNLVYFDRYGEAMQAFDTARSLNMPQRMLRYLFSPFLAYFHGGRNEDLLALADYALTVTPNSEEALLWKGWGLYRAGQTFQALESFQKALEYNPNYSDAQYAIRFVQEQ